MSWCQWFTGNMHWFSWPVRGGSHPAPRCCPLEHFLPHCWNNYSVCTKCQKKTKKKKAPVAPSAHLPGVHSSLSQYFCCYIFPPNATSLQLSKNNFCSGLRESSYNEQVTLFFKIVWKSRWLKLNGVKRHHFFKKTSYFLRVQSLALLSGLRIRRCHELLCKLQTRPARIASCCGSGVGWWLQLWLDP